MIIRPADIRDAETLYDFVLRLDREDEPARSPVMTADDIRVAGFGPDPLFEALMAEDNQGAPLGAISFFRGYSGWYAGATAFVHMLFVTEEARGKGIGRALVSTVAALAVKRNWRRIDLLVENGNPAKDFYESIGLCDAGDRHYSAEGKTLMALAKS